MGVLPRRRSRPAWFHALGLGLGLALTPVAVAAPPVRREPADASSTATATELDAPATASVDASADATETTSTRRPYVSTLAVPVPEPPVPAGSASVSAAVSSASPTAPVVPAAERPERGRTVDMPGEKAPPPESRAKPQFVVTPRGQYFVRGQSRFNTKFAPEAGDRESAVLQRIRLGLLAETGPLRMYGEFQDVRQWGFEATTYSNEANVDLHQGYVELGGKGKRGAGSIIIGRQEIQFGSTRLFVDMHWNPHGQSFDAVRASGRIGVFGVDVAAIMLAPPRTFTVEDPGGDPSLAATIRSRGSYTGFVLLSANLHKGLNVEGLVLGVSERPTPARPTVERDIINSGLRVHGTPRPGLLYDVEAYGQVGRDLGLPHRAWATFATLTYTFQRRLQPGLSLRYNYASGQACTGGPEEGCGNTRSGEFFRFFGLRHARYGIADLAANSNLRSLEVGAHLRPHETLNLDLGYHFMQLDQSTGRWRDAGDRLIGVGWDPSNQDRALGHEVNFTATYRPWKQLFIQPGYAVFVPLAAARRIAGPEPQHFVFLWMVAKF